MRYLPPTVRCHPFEQKAPAAEQFSPAMEAHGTTGLHETAASQLLANMTYFH